MSMSAKLRVRVQVGVQARIEARESVGVAKKSSSRSMTTNPKSDATSQGLRGGRLNECPIHDIVAMHASNKASRYANKSN